MVNRSYGSDRLERIARVQDVPRGRPRARAEEKFECGGHSTM
jgi:hypothetical protein